jgi:3-hydroxyisobutyrate dehydrogenase
MADNGPQVAILGVGTMGRGMAHSLLRAGFSPLLWNRNSQRLIPFAGTGARTFESVSDAVQDADVVITMVSDANAVLDVADRQGMVDALRPGAVWVQMGTIGVVGFDRVAALVAQRRLDVVLVDAPVTGSREGAEDGTLTIFASGPDTARSALRSVFEAIGQKTLWLGPAGQGTRLKLVNNTMIAFIVQGLGEALGIADHLDLATEAVIDAFGSAMFASPYISNKLLRIVHGQYDAEFSLALALKDVKLALDTVDATRHPVLYALARQWQQANDEGLGSQDLTAIARVLVEPR